MRVVMWAAVGCAMLPIVTAVIRAIAEGWLPIGDDGYFAIRSRDVLTDHHPLVGAWSSGSQTIGTSVNNFGPIQLDLLAPFTKLDPGAGTAVAVGLTHVLAIGGIALVVRRMAGPLAATGAMAVCTWLGWLMGSGALLQPRQHSYLIFVLLCFFTLAWAVMDGRPWALPWASFVGSFILQTQLAYGFVTGLVAVAALACFGVVTYHRSKSGGPAWTEHRHATRRAAAVSGVILLVVWAQPLIDQFFGDGNLRRVLTTPGGGDKPGAGDALRLVASILTTPHQWVRPAFGEYEPNDDLTSLPLALLGLAVLVAVLVVALRAAIGHADNAVRAALVTALCGVAAAIITSAMIPTAEFGYTPDNSRWLWPLTGFVAIVLFSVLTRQLGGRWRTTTSGDRATIGRFAIPRTAIAATFGVLAVILAVANLPAYATYTTYGLEPLRLERAKELIGQLDADGLPDVVLFDREASFFGEPYTYAVMLRLDELDVEFTLDDSDGNSTDVARFGDSRAHDGQAELRLRFDFGEDAREEPAGETRVAFVAGLDDAELQELDDLQASLVTDLQAGAIEIDFDAARSTTANVEPLHDVLAGEPVDAVALASALRPLDEAGLLTTDESTAADVRRFADLGQRQQLDTLALFLGPVDHETVVPLDDGP